MSEVRFFPVMPAGYITWEMAESAYEVYSFLYGDDQSLERMAQRGGFHWLELGELLQGKELERAKKRGFRFKKPIPPCPDSVRATDVHIASNQKDLAF